MVRNFAQWPNTLPKKYRTARMITSRDLAEIGGISRISISRFWIKRFPTAYKVGGQKNAPWAIPTEDVVEFLKQINKPTTK